MNAVCHENHRGGPTMTLLNVLSVLGVVNDNLYFTHEMRSSISMTRRQCKENKHIYSTELVVGQPDCSRETVHYAQGGIIGRLGLVNRFSA